MKPNGTVLNWTPSAPREWNWEFLSKWTPEERKELEARRKINRQRPTLPPAPPQTDFNRAVRCLK